MGSHLPHKNLKRSRKIIGTPEVYPGKLRLVFGLLRVIRQITGSITAEL